MMPTYKLALLIAVLLGGQVSALLADDWPMLGRTSARNPVVPGGVGPADWNIGEFDLRTGKWDTRGAKNIKWQAKLGSETYGTPVVADGQVYVGTNNGAGYLERYPNTVDLGCLLCFRESDGEFLWQFSVEKHPAGRVHDWPGQGMGCTPLVEDKRLWIVSNRWEVVCLDTQGFRDGKNDGPYQEEPVQSEIEADVIWKLDLIGQLGVYPHPAGMGPDRRCSIAAWGDRIYVVTGNGVDEGHFHLPAPDAPSLVCLNKHTGEVLWTDNSPGKNILHTQIASPLVAEIAGQVQVIVPQGDGWVRSFLAESGKLIWEFDINPKTSRWSLSRATRNNILATPVLYQDRIYVASGQEAEHGSGPGRLVCIDPAKSGDISSELAVDHNGDRIPHRRLQAVDPNKGEQAVANPNSGLVWEFTSESDDAYDQMHRTLSSVAVHRGLVIAADLEGFVHCLDAHTGKKHWTYDTFANVWAAPLVVGERVYIANEDGEVFIFDLSADPTQANNPTQQSMHSAVYTFPIFASGTLYLATRNTLYAIGPGNAAGAEDFSAAPQSQPHIPALRTKASDAAKPRVPKAAFVPTPRDVVVAMLELAGLQADELVCDLGSGDGRIPITAARDFGAKGLGYELDRELVLESRRDATAADVTQRVRFAHSDLFDADLSAVDVVTIYLYPAQAGALLPRFKTLKAGTRIIAHQYGLPGIAPDETLKMQSTDSGEMHTIYRYTTPLVHSQDTGTLKARFVYGGDAPEAEKIDITKDLKFCGPFAHKSERLIVDKATNQIKNVVLSVFTGRGGSELPPAVRTPKTVTLATVNCRFEPHVLCLQAGDTLELVQRDPVGSGGYGGVNLGFLINPPHNFTIRPNAPRVIKIEKAEPTPIQVTCMMYNWMHAHLIVLDHPFVSVSDDQGKVEIKDLPAGNELVFRLFHESAQPIPEVEIDGQNVTLDRNLIRLMIKPGMNDLGTIVIPAASFGRD